jgi:hypothetical protein
LLTRQGLVQVKVRALRQQLWFNTLTQLERSIVDLTIRCVEQVRSRILAKMVSQILVKLRKTQKPSFLKVAEAIGRAKAAAICTVALTWGNGDAAWWQRDRSFVRLLGVNAMNH